MLRFFQKINMLFKNLKYKKAFRFIRKNPTIWHSLEFVRKSVIFLVGSTVVMLGIALVFLPGPAFVVIPLGLSILGAEFVWAKRILRHAKKGAWQAASKCLNSVKKRGSQDV